MWNWMVGKLKSGHALDRELGSARSRQRFIDALPSESPDAALKAVTRVFEASIELGLKPEVRMQALCELDDFVQPSRRELLSSLIENSPKQVLREEGFALLLQHCTAWAAAYEDVLADSKTAGSDRGLQAQRVLAACRALRALSTLDLLLRMRYRDSPPGFWVRVEGICAAAGTRAQLSATLALYQAEAEETSVLREYLSILLFAVAPLTNLLPAQIHAVALVLRRHAEHYRLSDCFDPAAAPFAIEPGSDSAPVRWLEGLPSKPGLRFFGMGAGYGHMLEGRDQAQKNRTVAAWLAPSQISAERYRELLERLAEQWGVKPPARRQRRDAESAELLVAHEFNLIRKLVTLSHLARNGQCTEYDRSGVTLLQGSVPRRCPEAAKPERKAAGVPADEALLNLEALERKLEQDPIETWTLSNSSADGLGVEVVGKGEWVKVGTLIGYRRPESPQWSLAVVRWLRRGADQRLRVGLRKLPGEAFSGRIHMNDPRQRKPRQADAPTLHYDVIELDQAPSCLVLAPGVYDPASRYTLSIGQRWDFLRMQRCIECGLDFEVVEFQVLSAEQAA